MKKFVVCFLVVIITLFSVSCSKEEKVIQEPDITQVRSICNLATLECYYHNVAKSEKTAGDGISGWFEKDRTFWVEYTGTAKIGVDMSKVKMEIDGTNVTIVMPEAELLSIGIDESSLSESSFVFSEDSWFNSNKITANDQTAAINAAQENMEEAVKNNSALLQTAQNRAKELIENYINQLGKVSGVEYVIKWQYEEVENEG